MSSVLVLPESVRDYMLNPGVRTAVDHLLSQKPADFAPDLQWHEILSYHDALLMAAKVQRDYVATLIDAWQLIWKPVLERHGIVKDVPFSEYISGNLPSPEVIWEDALYRIYEIPGHPKKAWLYTAMALLPKEGLAIYIAAEEMQKYRNLLPDTDGFKFWKKDENGYLKSKLAGSIDESGQIAVGSLIEAAEEAVTYLIEEQAS